MYLLRKVVTKIDYTKAVSLRPLSLVLLVTGILAIFLVLPFVHAIVVGLVVAIFFSRPHQYFIKLSKGNKGIATILSLVLVTLLVIVPLTILTSVIALQVQEFTDDISTLNLQEGINAESVTNAVNGIIKDLPFDIEQVTPDGLVNIVSDLWQRVIGVFLTGVLNLGLSVIANFPSYIVFFFAVTGFLNNMSDMGGYLRKLIPFPKDVTDTYFTRTREMLTSMVKGTLLIALVKGLMTGLFLGIAGVSFLPVWTLIAIVACIIPIGSGIVSIPIGVVFILTGDPLAGLFLILTSILITENIEIFLRPKLVSEQAKLPDAILIIAVLGGLSLFGFMGILYGPIIMILFITTLEVYRVHIIKG